MTFPRVMVLGLALGITFTVGAALADIAHAKHLPHPHVYADIHDYLTSLNK